MERNVHDMVREAIGGSEENNKLPVRTFGVAAQITMHTSRIQVRNVTALRSLLSENKFIILNCFQETGQEIPSPLWDTKFRYRIHKNLPLKRILCQTNPPCVLRQGLFSHGATVPGGVGTPRYRGFTVILIKHTTLGRTPLDERLAHRKDLYLTTNNTHKIQAMMPPAGFEPAIPASERPQTQAFDRTSTSNAVHLSEIFTLPSHLQLGSSHLQFS